MSDYLITVPEPAIKLYNDGFKEICKFGRASEGKKLSALVEKFSQPMSIALDAPWGAGKSVFLKCWVGAHSKENGGTANTVYFDAFRNDFMDDPLIGLTASISERFETGSAKAKVWTKAKDAAFKLVRPALRIGLAAATAGGSEVVGIVADAGLEAGSKELEQASREFWRKEDGKRAAMEAFRDALIELTDDKKLVIVVDELDRCRPDYALNLLEVIKHFFDVPNVHFVLGVNLKELANSVRARYGSNIEAEKYLQKFVSITMPLIPQQQQNSSARAQVRHFKAAAIMLGIEENWCSEWIGEYLRVINHHAKLSLRDVERIATLSVVTPSPAGKVEADPHLYVGALILSVVAPQAVEKARLGELKGEDVFSIFDLKDRTRSGTDRQLLHFRGKLFCKSVVDTGLHINTVGADASLRRCSETLRSSDASIASSRLASSKTMNGALPPNSSDIFLIVPAHCSIRILPTRIEPVKVIFRTFWLEHSSLPTPDASVEGITLNTPAGIPARSPSTAIANADKGVNSAGRATNVYLMRTAW